MAKVGGLYSIVRSSIMMLARVININAILGAMIEQIYFHNNGSKKFNRIFLSLFEGFTYPFTCFFTPTLQQKLFREALHSIKQEVDIVNIVITLRKLKAGLSAVIANDSHLMDNASRIFYWESTIGRNEKVTKSKF